MKGLLFVAISVAVTAFSNLAFVQKALTAEEARGIARDAYIYAYPMVENYLSIYQFALHPNGSQYKGPLNGVHNVARVFTPEDTGVVTPNSDTPYSFLIMDLRAEPLVVTLPAVEASRYYSLQLVDLYSHNVDYLGTRIDGNNGGDFLIAGPGWKGEMPTGIRRVVRMPTEIAFSQFRTQLYDSGDLDRVKEIQAGYRARPLSEYISSEKPAAPPSIGWPVISRETAQKDFWSYANFLLQFAPPLAWESEMRERFAAIGVIAGAPWPPANLSPEVAAAVAEAADAGQRGLAAELMKITSSAGLFGTPEEMRGKYRERALGAMGGLYGNSAEEALYPAYMTDSQGRSLDASKYNYVLRFSKNHLPPAKAFWSITMYHGDSRFLVKNPIDRYLVNSAMLTDLKPNAVGEIAIYMQHENPGAGLEANWLPAPNGPMGVVMRLYLPEPQALDGRWQQPSIEASPRR